MTHIENIPDGNSLSVRPLGLAVYCWAQVQSVVGEVTSHRLHCAVKNQTEHEAKNAYYISLSISSPLHFELKYIYYVVRDTHCSTEYWLFQLCSNFSWLNMFISQTFSNFQTLS